MGVTILKDTQEFQVFKALGTEPAAFRSDEIRSLSTNLEAEFPLTMKWIKKGVIFRVHNQYDWMSHHACVPVADFVDDKVLRIYFGPRDSQEELALLSSKLTRMIRAVCCMFTTDQFSTLGSWEHSMTAA
jgi:hypothetical protein